ncbi:hypothetical protein OsI_18084 [Oryza sativa Indica Group]|uniref:Uncharacterized protein n=1 Tax=Oryza sativa subsp. indica TaxID=39946 RepID=A2XZD9_ORYSI|nr:hypothetical protein OsI_18084 [Oryza sativa Indica Group]
MDKMNTGARSEKIDQSLQKYDHPRCRWHILFGTKSELHNLYHARIASDFEDTWTALVNEYGLQEENAYLQKAQMLIDDETKPNDSQEIDTDRKDVKREVEAPKLIISRHSDDKFSS